MRGRLLFVAVVVLIAGAPFFLVPLQSGMTAPEQAEHAADLFRQVGILVIAIAAILLIRMPE